MNAPGKLTGPELRNGLSVVVPTYNERNNILPLVERTSRALAGREHEILFVDDNSPDGTADAVRQLEDRFPVRVIVRKDKRGLASAVVDGIGSAAGDMITVIDADLQHPPETIPALVRALEEGADVAIASRYVEGGGCVGWGLVRKAISRGAIMISHLFLPQTKMIHDPMSGFFMVRREVVEGAELTPTGYKILLEILGKGKYGRVAEVPYVFHPRVEGKSKLGVRTQLDYLRHVYSLSPRLRELVRLITFCLVGGSGILVNLGIAWLLTEMAGLSPNLGVAIGIETSVITNFLLNDALTFRDRRRAGAGNFVVRLVKFQLVSLVGVGVNYGVFWLLHNQAGVHYLLGDLAGIAVAFVWNYLANRFWTWR